MYDKLNKKFTQKIAKDRQVTFRTSIEQFEKVERIKKAYRISTSDFVYQAIDLLLENYDLVEIEKQERLNDLYTKHFPDLSLSTPPSEKYKEYVKVSMWGNDAILAWFEEMEKAGKILPFEVFKETKFFKDNYASLKNRRKNNQW
jgi:RNA processing factor Prp31